MFDSTLLVYDWWAQSTQDATATSVIGASISTTTSMFAVPKDSCIGLDGTATATAVD